MDCDDQIRLVKRDDHSYANAADFSSVARLSIFIPIDEHRFLDNAFHIVHCGSKATKEVLGIPGKAHALSRAQAKKLSSQMIERTLTLIPRAAELLDEIVDESVFLANEIPMPTPTERAAPKVVRDEPESWRSAPTSVVVHQRLQSGSKALRTRTLGLPPP